MVGQVEETHRCKLVVLIVVAVLAGACTSAPGAHDSAAHPRTTQTTIPPTIPTTMPPPTTTTTSALVGTMPVETESNGASVTFSGFTVCSLRPDPQVLGGGVDATASGAVTVYPPANGGEVEMDIIDKFGNVLRDGSGLPRALQSFVSSPQPVSFDTIFSPDDLYRVKACLVYWVVPAAPSNQTQPVLQPPPPPPPPTTTTTYPVLP